MALGETLIDKSGDAHQMLGLLGLVTSFEKRKFHLGYRLATAKNPIAALGSVQRLRGHEFHYTTILEQPDEPLFDVVDANHDPVPETGSSRGQVSGTFFHLISEAS